MPELSVLIPARNEMFLTRTINDVLEHAELDTEIIVILDESWPEHPIPLHPKVTVVHRPVPLGQRAATNEAARLSQANFIMKLDGHCAVEQGFDRKLLEPYRTGELSMETTTIPRMYNLKAFDRKCPECGKLQDMGPMTAKCAGCGKEVTFGMELAWTTRRKTDFARFDRTLHFQYWGDYGRRKVAQGELADVMCFVGACFLMPRERYWELGGLDEEHGSWGQMGVEISCKSWLSGGRQVVNKRTWFAHMFRTQPGFGFPYANPESLVVKAREHSRWLWMGNNWPQARHPLVWLLRKFAPVPDWEDYIQEPSEAKAVSVAAVPEPAAPAASGPKLGLVYYTDSRLDERIAGAVQRQIERAAPGFEIVSVSLGQLNWGHNIQLPLERSYLTMFKQILAGLEASTADIVFLAEHDVLYHPEHFGFRPTSPGVFYYNENSWRVSSADGRALFYYAMSTSGLCAHRELLLEHYRERVARVQREGKYDYHIGFEPGAHARPRGIDDYGRQGWCSLLPNIDIRHDQNLTPSRWRREQFRNQKYTRGWAEAEQVSGWGPTAGRFWEFLAGLE